MDLDSVDIFEACLIFLVTVLILNTDPPVIIELTPEIDMIGLLDPQIITSC